MSSNTLDETFVQLAIEQAKISEQNGGLPIGAVLVKDGKVIAAGQSYVWKEKDPTNHAEVNVIRAACDTLQQIDLQGCTLYSTLEPCGMCLSLCGWSNIQRIVFGAYKEDIPPNPYELTDYHAQDYRGRLVGFGSGQPVEIQGGVLRQACANLMQNVEGWAPKNST